MTAAARAYAEARAQGLPPTVTDPAAIARIASMLRHAADDAERR